MAEEMQRQEAERQRKLRQGTAKINEVFSQFDDDFFSNRRQAYIDYATPQLEQQYGDAQKQLTFALARAGLLDSSARGQKAGELQQLFDTNRQGIADEALGYENQARNAIEDARANLISMLNATGDVQGAVNLATQRASALAQPQPYSPLAQAFAHFTEGLGARAAAQRADYWMRAMQPGGSGATLYRQSPGSVRIR